MLAKLSTMLPREKPLLFSVFWGHFLLFLPKDKIQTSIFNSWIIFGINDKILKSKSSVQQKKFYKLLQESKTGNDPEKVIFNFSKYALSDIEKKLLAKGLNFCLPPKQLKYADYLVHFELFYRDIRNLEILSNEDLDFVKTKTKETALSSFRQYNKNPQQNLSKEELAALTNLSKNKNVVS